MFWEGTGVLHGEKAEGVLADVAKERAKKGEDIAIVKDAAEYADRETGVVQRRLDAGWPEDDQRISGENDPEWHRARAKRYRSQGRDDLADTALKLASEKETAGPFGKINPSDYTTESIKHFKMPVVRIFIA